LTPVHLAWVAFKIHRKEKVLPTFYEDVGEAALDYDDKVIDLMDKINDAASKSTSNGDLSVSTME
jgi:hypothetical protein